jgi:hypothetical protein
MNRILAAALLFGISGCVNSLEFFRKDSLSRAAFELNCPVGQTTAIELNPNTIGVSGCSKRSVYLYDPATGYWVNNTGVQSDSSPLPAASSPTK